MVQWICKVKDVLKLSTDHEIGAASRHQSDGSCRRLCTRQVKCWGQVPSQAAVKGVLPVAFVLAAHAGKLVPDRDEIIGRCSYGERWITMVHVSLAVQFLRIKPYQVLSLSRFFTVLQPLNHPAGFEPRPWGKWAPEELHRKTGVPDICRVSPPSRTELFSNRRIMLWCNKL
jgi:hypothetical protein